MITVEKARQILTAHLATLEKYVTGGFVVFDEHTISKPYGWIFFYNSKRFVESGALEHAIAGNGPVVVLADTGEVVSLGTHRDPREMIAMFERERGLSG